MGVDGVLLDDKAKRMRDLLSSFYSQDPSSNSVPANTSGRYATLDTINTTAFDADEYMNLLVQKSNLDGLLQRHVEMAAEIKNLDTDLQMLVYENYNKFISATDTIKRMKSNIVGMEVNMEHLLEKIMSVQSRSDGVNTSLFGKREHIEKLHRARNLLRKVQFICDLPTRLGKCIKSEAYADAVRFYTGAMPIFQAYGDSSFLDCKRASEEVISVIIKNLQVLPFRRSFRKEICLSGIIIQSVRLEGYSHGKVFSDSESIQARAQAVMLLKQLNFQVDNLKEKLLEKLEQFVVDLHIESVEITHLPVDHDEAPKQGNITDPTPATAHGASIREFVEAVRAYRVLFPDSREQLIRLLKDLVSKHFEATQHHIVKHISSADLLGMLCGIWTNVLLMDEVLPEASLPDFALEAARIAVKQYVASTFSHLLLDISDPLTKLQIRQEGLEEEYSLQASIEASKKAVIQGTMDVLLDFRKLLEENLGLLLNLKSLIVDWVQEGFQDFFRNLDDHFLSLSRENNLKSQGSAEGSQSDKVLAGRVLVMAQLSLFIEESAIPRIIEELAASFSGGGAGGYESGPAFVPAEICRTFHSTSEKFLHLYINMGTQKISVLLRRRFLTPNWVKHKEPREVRMFVDMFLQQLQAIGTEVKRVLPQGPHLKHWRTDSNESATSSCSNPLRDDKHRGRSQLLETHLANLFKQKTEIFTKVEHTQESVQITILKLCLKSVQEFVRSQTFNRSGFQQIQLDVQFLRTVLKETAEDEAAVDFLLDEVIVAAVERCLDSIPLEPAILDKLIQAKLAKSTEQKPVSS